MVHQAETEQNDMHRWDLDVYDVLNRFIIDCDITHGKFDEMKTEERQVDQLPDTIGSKQSYFIIMDRVYPSIPSFLRMIDKDIKFVIPLKTSDFKKEQHELMTYYRM